MAQYTTQLQQLYLAYFSRPADLRGLQFWEGVVEAAHGDTNAVSAAFAGSAEYKAAYANLSNADAVTKVYANLFSHGPDTPGLNFWVHGLDSHAFTIDQVVKVIADGALGTDLALFNLRTEAATAFTESLDTTAKMIIYANASSKFVPWIAEIVDQASYDEHIAQLPFLFDGPDFPPPFPGFVLTEHADTATAHEFLALAHFAPGGDSFINTLQDDDTLTGTAAPDDSLSTLIAINSTPSVTSPTLTSIEDIEVQFNGTGGDDARITSALDLLHTVGVRSVDLARLSTYNTDVAVRNLEAGATALSMHDANAKGDVTFSYREGALAAHGGPGADNGTLLLNNVQLRGLTIDEMGQGANERGNGFEKMDVTVSGIAKLGAFNFAANAREDASDGTAQTLNVKVDAALTINALNANGVEYMNITANAPVLVMADENAVPSAANDGISTPELMKLTINGGAPVTIGGLNGDTGAASGAATFYNATGLVVDAAAMTDKLTLGVEGGTSNDAAFSVTAGSGSDVIQTYGVLGGKIATGLGNDTVTIGAAGASMLFHGAAIDTGAGNDSVTGGDLVGDGDNLAGMSNNHAFADLAPSISTGAGNDRLTLGALGNAASFNAADGTWVLAGAVVDAGEGDDTIAIGAVAENARMLAGDGNDSVTVRMSMGVILAADSADVRELSAIGGSADTVGATLDLGNGDDNVTFSDEGADISDTLGTDGAIVNATTIVGAGARLTGGAGANVLNVKTVDDTTLVVAATSADQDKLITGFQTLNFTALNAVDAQSRSASSVNANDNNGDDGEAAPGHGISADLLRLDAALSTINLASQEAALPLNFPGNYAEAGSETYFTLHNMRADVTTNLTAQDVSVSGANRINGKADERRDVTLTVDFADGSANDDVFVLNIRANPDLAARPDISADAGAFDLSLHLNASSNPAPTGSGPDVDRLIEFAVINLADDKSHKFFMNGFGDQFQSGPVVDGSKAPVTGMSINDSAAGQRITVADVNTDIVAIRGEADARLTIGLDGLGDTDTVTRDSAHNNYIIGTDRGNDVINMIADAVNASDRIDAGNGNDRLIINGGNSLDADAFHSLAGFENLELAKGGSNALVLSEAAQAMGLRNLYLTGGTDALHADQSTVLTIGDAFNNSLLIDAGADLTGDAGYGAKVGAVSLYIDNQDSAQDAALVDLDLHLSLQNGAGLVLINSGDSANHVTISATLASAGFPNVIANGAGGADLNGDGQLQPGEMNNAVGPGLLNLDVWQGEVDKITLLDSVNAARTDNNSITVTMDKHWSRTAFELDASNVANNDASVGGETNGEVEGRSAITQYASVLTAGYSTAGAVVAGIQDGDSGGLAFDGRAELDARLTVRGTGNDDFITGGQNDDILEGNAGDDLIDGGLGADNLKGGAGRDSIDGGSGNDFIFGGTGADLLSGGSGVDTFYYTSLDESPMSEADTITDFRTGIDKIVLDSVVKGGDGADIINIATFSTVGSLAAASLLGSAATPVQGDWLYATNGHLVVDVGGSGDLGSSAILSIVSTNAIGAGDVNFKIDAGGGNDIIRGGRGADTLAGGDGDDQFVLLGTLSSADLAANAAARQSAYDLAYGATSGTDAQKVAAANAAGDAAISPFAVQVLSASELLSSTRGMVSDANAGDSIDGGNGNDRLDTFGTVDLTPVNGGADLKVETLVVHGNANLTLAQLNGLVALVFDGNAPHSLTIIGGASDGTDLGAWAAANGHTIVLAHAGALATFTIGDGGADSAAQFIAAYGASTSVQAPSASGLATNDIVVELVGGAGGVNVVE